MTTVKFDISQAPELAKYLELGLDKVAKRAVLSTALRVVQRISTEVIPGEAQPPVDRRVYSAGWRAFPTDDGAEIVNRTPYAAVIEYGARAENIKIGRAMIQALAAWVKRKGMAGKGKGAAEAATQIAWAIAMKMKQRGIFNGGKGLRILEKGMKRVLPFFGEELRREIKREWG